MRAFTKEQRRPAEQAGKQETGLRGVFLGSFRSSLTRIHARACGGQYSLNDRLDIKLDKLCAWPEQRSHGHLSLNERVCMLMESIAIHACGGSIGMLRSS